MSIKESLYVLGVIFSNTFILTNLYELIPITYYPSYVHKKNKTIPYFNIESSFVNIIPNLGKKDVSHLPVRGIRAASSGGAGCSFGNSIAADFQILGKNFHIKIYSSAEGRCKLHITGLTSWEQVNPVVAGFINKLKEVDAIWAPFFRLSYESRLNFMKKVYDVVVSGHQVRHFEDPYVVGWIDSFTGDMLSLKQCAKLIVEYVMEDLEPEKFGQRLTRLCSIQTGQYSAFHKEQDFTFSMFDIYNGVYTGTIGYGDLYFIHIVRRLACQGYHVGFSNLGRDEIRIRIEIQSDHTNAKGGKSENKKEHLFIIKSSGSVSLSSKASTEEALSMGRHVIGVIKTIVESKEYSSEKFGISYDVMSSTNQLMNTSDIFPQTQMSNTSMVPSAGSFSVLDSLMDEYGYGDEI